MNRNQAVEAILGVIASEAKELTIDHVSELSDEDYELLGEATSLQRLRLIRCNTKSQHIPHIANLTNLVELEMPGHDAHHGLAALRPLTGLEKLDVSDGFFLGDEHIQDMLRDTYPSIGINVDNSRAQRLLGRLLRRRELEVQAPVDPPLPPLYNLTCLGLERTHVTDKIGAALKRIEYLRSVSLDDTDTGDAVIADLATLPLTYVGLGRLVTDAGLLSLPNTLQGITLRANRDWFSDKPLITQGGFEQFARQHPNLEDLNIYSPRFGIMRAVAMLKHLKKAALTGSMSDHELRLLAELTEVEDLWVSSNDCRHTWVPALQRCQKLKRLAIAGIEFNDDAVPELSKLEQIEDLRLDCTWVSDRGVKQLREALPNCEVHDIRARIGRSCAQ